MTLPDRNALWRWLASAPLSVVLSICLSTTGALGTWVWAVVGDVQSQKAAVAVAVEQAKDATRHTQTVESRLIRLEEKLDRLLEVVADLRARSRPEKERNR